jgi:hypothetical protein
LDVAIQNDQDITIWRFSDGRAGHDSQSIGLIRALGRYKRCTAYDIRTRPFYAYIPGLLSGHFTDGTHLKAPDLLIGAGHGTHFPMLCARRARGGKTIVLMQPSLPVNWFDYCLIPAHDHPSAKGNIMVTRGALNSLWPSDNLDPGKGMVLVGGASRHYHWDEITLIEQIRTVTRNDLTWCITDSRRTPDSTRTLLRQRTSATVTYKPCSETGPGWLAGELQTTGTVWVTADSISMIYEALTAGAAVGVFLLPIRKPGRITRAIEDLINTNFITHFEDWQTSRVLAAPAAPLNEADRCARLLLGQPGLLRAD